MGFWEVEIWLYDQRWWILGKENHETLLALINKLILYLRFYLFNIDNYEI